VTSRRVRHALPLLVLLGLLGCASTRYEGTPESSGAGGGPTTTEVITGSAAELLPRLAETAESLSGVMIAEGDDDAVAARITALWDAVRDEVTAARPELVDNFDANVERCRNAVQFHRAADADKAARNLRALVDTYLG
jgi:hypothetical protein